MFSNFINRLFLLVKVFLFFSFFTFFNGLLFSHLFSILLDLFQSPFFTDSFPENVDKTILTMEEKIALFKKVFSEKYISGHILENEPIIRGFSDSIPAAYCLSPEGLDPEFYQYLNDLNTIEEVKAKAEEIAASEQRNAIVLFFAQGILVFAIMLLFSR